MSWLGWTLDQWGTVGTVAGAGAAVVTTGIAALAARFGFNQVKEARDLREEQAQPYVVAYFEISRASTMYIDLVVRNVGHTLARDVRISLDPALESTLDERGFKMADVYFLTKGVPALPPAMEYRMLFESGPELDKRKDLPRQYSATVSFRTERGRECRLDYILDLDTFYGYETLAVYGDHDSAVALRDISKTVKSWTGWNGMRVYTRNEDALIRERAQRHQARKSEPTSAKPALGPEQLKAETAGSESQVDL